LSQLVTHYLLDSVQHKNISNFQVFESIKWLKPKNLER